MSKNKDILVTGGAGYVGTSLVPKLLKEGHKVTIYDTFWFINPEEIEEHQNLTIIKADIRDLDSFSNALIGKTDVIHLACISNDPSFDLDPELGKSINFDCFEELVKRSKNANIERFIYASSSSVYGVKEEPNVTEDLSLEPLTDYSKYKADCEKILNSYGDDNFTVVSIRPATVCGYSQRQRLDVVVNILTNHAINNKVIKIFGGDQKRPNIHIDDMCDVYLKALIADKKIINKEVYNAGGENLPVKEIAKLVSEITGVTELNILPTDDIRSYHISSDKISKDLGFKAKKSVRDAISDLSKAMDSGLLENTMTDSKYFNVQFVKDLSEKAKSRH
jgi:nucleoside-diphosphate-sugar epimerase